MAPGEIEQSIPGDASEKLMAELEQARALLESAQEELTGVAAERDRLRSALEAERALRHRYQAMVASFTEQNIAPSFAVEAEALRSALEEVRIATEHLEQTNTELERANRELEERVAARTAELTEANGALTRVNTELNRRVQEETEARVAAQAQLLQAQSWKRSGN